MKRFMVVPTADKYKWDLPQEMADYANSYIHQYIPEKDLFDTILFENPVPNNVKNPQKLDDFVTPLLSNQDRKFDDILSKVQRKTVDFGASQK